MRNIDVLAKVALPVMIPARARSKRTAWRATIALIAVFVACQRSAPAPTRAALAVSTPALGAGHWLPIAALRLLGDDGTLRIELSAAGEVQLAGVLVGRIAGDQVVAPDGNPLLDVGANGVVALNFADGHRPFTTSQSPLIAPDGALWTRLGDFAVGRDGVPTIARREVDPASLPVRAIGASARPPARMHARFVGYRPELQSTAVALLLLETNSRAEAHIRFLAPGADR